MRLAARALVLSIALGVLMADATAADIGLTAQHFFPAAYEHPVLADVDRDGRPELVAYSAGRLSVIDPRAGLRIVDVTREPAIGAPFAVPIQRQSGWPQAVVTVGLHSDVSVWRGIPLQPVVQFRVAHTVLGGGLRAGNVDADPADELVTCGVALRVVDLASRAVRELLPAITCDALELVQLDADPELEILVIPNPSMTEEPIVVDGATGDVLLVAPRAVGPDLLTANVDADPQTELLVRPSPLHAGYAVVDLVPTWSERVIVDLGATRDNFAVDAVVDRDGNGVADAVVRALPMEPAARVFGLDRAPPTTVTLPAECVFGMVAGDFAPAPGVELACPGLFAQGLDGTPVGVLAAPDYSVGPPALGDTDGDGIDEVLVALARATTDASVLALHPDTLAPLGATDVTPPGPRGATLRLTAVQADTDPALELVLTGAGQGVALYDPGARLPSWSIEAGMQGVSHAVLRIDTPAASDDVAIARSLPDGCRVSLLDAATGAARWTTTPLVPLVSAAEPLLVTTTVDAFGGPGLVVACGDMLQALRLADGSKVWERPTLEVTDLDVAGDGAERQLIVTLGEQIPRRSLANGIPTDGRYGGSAITEDYRLGDVRIGIRGDALVVLDVRTAAPLATRAAAFDARTRLVSRPAGTRTRAVYANAADAIVRLDVVDRDTLSLDRQSITGLWYEPSRAGQGFALEVFPSLTGPGFGLVSGGWFTFDTGLRLDGEPNGPRWFSVYGGMFDGDRAAQLSVGINTGGALARPPITTTSGYGAASFTLFDCNHARFSYRMPGDLSGTMELERLTPSVGCTSAATENDAADFGLSGNWFDPASSVQGFVIEVNPRQPIVVFAWYTYAADGQPVDGAPGQRWFTGQTTYAPGARTFTMPIHATSGGQFDVAPSATQATVAVGTATLTFASCAQASFAYAFSAGENAGREGSIALERVGPTPAGCRL